MKEGIVKSHFKLLRFLIECGIQLWIEQSGWVIKWGKVSNLEKVELECSYNFTKNFLKWNYSLKTYLLFMNFVSDTVPDGVLTWSNSLGAWHFSWLERPQASKQLHKC